ncbi:MAG TPA: right-handed parallel beta-helix repeat-containing protein [Planctomycetota bacterium]|nr:right-handed parallel beta-helix repeat-containing protein [Planctomycetota bacterium]
MLRTGLAACVLLLLASRASADTLQVPQDFATIQEAVDAANDGDTILVHAGTYAEAVAITNKTNLLVKAAGKVIVDPPDLADGITLTGCDTCTVEKLRVIDAVNGLLLVDCFTCTVSKCRVDAVSGLGVALEDCNNCFVEKCTITGAGTDGIGVGANGTTACALTHISKNKIIEPGDDGVDLNGTNGIIEKNTVIDAGGNGYRSESVPPATTNTWVKCKSFGAQNHGFEINGASNSIFFCTEKDSGVNGFACAGSGTYQLLKVKSTHATGTGIVVEAGLDGTSVTSCKVKQPGADGISMQANGALVSRNKVTAAGNDGFAVGGNDGFYEKNSAMKSNSDGFQLLGTGNELTKNKAKGSVTGFDLDDQSGGLNLIDDDNTFGTTGP